MGFLNVNSRSTTRYWPARCGSCAKAITLIVLILAFLAQTYFVYTDTKDSVQLDPLATAGRQLWMQNNCQACHQLHGFGGFLGPDLTNATARLELDQLESKLALGEGQMPLFEMDSNQALSLWAFLSAMNETGIGQARNPNLVQVASISQAREHPRNIAIEQVIAESGDVAAGAGFEIFQSNTCQACHVPFAHSSVGAPDLSLSGGTLSDDEIRSVLEHGRLPKMPPSGLSEDQRASVLAFIQFKADHRDEILSRVVDEPRSFWTSLPWWEYE